MSRSIIGVDPGPSDFAWVAVEPYASGPVVSCGQVCSAEPGLFPEADVWIERITPQGTPTGQDTIDTAVTIGRILEGCREASSLQLVRRRSVVSEILGGTPKGADAMLRAHLIGVFGPVGTKKNPGPLWPLKELGSHGFAALAVAYYGYLGRGIQGHDWWRFNFETGRCE